MSLREWYAAREQRQHEVRDRLHHVMETRQEFQAEMAALHEYQREMLTQFRQNLEAKVTEFLANTNANRAAIASVMWESLNNFHVNLQAEVAAFREETCVHQQEVWMEQQKRADYAAFIQDYLWGTTSTDGQFVNVARS